MIRDFPDEVAPTTTVGLLGDFTADSDIHKLLLRLSKGAFAHRLKLVRKGDVVADCCSGESIAGGPSEKTVIILFFWIDAD